MNRIATTLATAGIAVFASVALAPAASAATTAPVQDGPSYVLEANDAGNGPDAFIVTDQGRTPVFFCDDSGKHANKCAPIGDEVSGRF